ncbi:hypothetical protein J2T19_000001, partial [Paenibacillus tundrae]|nr:hypothetical protein [Paenibacillus tundrae]
RYGDSCKRSGGDGIGSEEAKRAPYPRDSLFERELKKMGITAIIQGSTLRTAIFKRYGDSCKRSGGDGIGSEEAKRAPYPRDSLFEKELKKMGITAIIQGSTLCTAIFKRYGDSCKRSGGDGIGFEEAKRSPKSFL